VIRENFLPARKPVAPAHEIAILGEELGSRVLSAGRYVQNAPLPESKYL
jgi:hypothetical protein